MTMNHSEYAKQVLAMLRKPPTSVPKIGMDEGRRKNAGRYMATLARNRLATTVYGFSDRQFSYKFSSIRVPRSQTKRRANVDDN